MGDKSVNVAVQTTKPALFNINKPLMQFFRRLIVSHGSQNTVLTNGQLEEILTKEFNINIGNLHPLQSQVYINVLKKYIKDWPMWVEFDKTIKDSPYDDSMMVKLIEKYENFKTYLRTVLDVSRQLTEQRIKKLGDTAQKEEEQVVDEDKEVQEVVLIVKATRKQLNKLFFRYPDPESSNTLFNISDEEPPSQIRVNTVSLAAILNWWSIRIQINLQWMPNNNSMFIRRETTHELEHLLVNKKLPKQPSQLVRLNDKVQIKDTKKRKRVSREEIIACLDFLYNKYESEIEGLDTIIQYLKKDFEKMPVCIAPAEYRRTLNKHPYIRYLCADSQNINNAESSKYDLLLKETLTPMHQFAIGKVEGKLESNFPADWLKIECVGCGATFTGKNIDLELKQHFDDHHNSEPDWQCSNCEKTFTMEFLAENWWRHDCLITYKKL